MAKFSASGGEKGPPAAPAAGFGGNFAASVCKSGPRIAQNRPQNEPNSLVSMGFHGVRTHKAQIGTPLAEAHDVRADPRVRGPSRPPTARQRAARATGACVYIVLHVEIEGGT